MSGYRKTSLGAVLELKPDASGRQDWITVEPRSALVRDDDGQWVWAPRERDTWAIFGRVEGSIVHLSIPSRSRRKRLAAPTLHQMAFLYRDLVVQHYQSDRSAA
jgi:hypothetical protein